jgi:hypothetical protein
VGFPLSDLQTHERVARLADSVDGASIVAHGFCPWMELRIKDTSDPLERQESGAGGVARVGAFSPWLPTAPSFGIHANAPRMGPQSTPSAGPNLANNLSTAITSTSRSRNPAPCTPRTLI